MLFFLKRTVEISRPVFWPSTFFTFLLGIILSHNAITPLSVVFALLWSFPYSLWISAVNDLHDKDTDSLNSFKGSISGTRILHNEEVFIRKLARISLIFILIPTIFTFNYLLLLFSVIALIIPYLYSAHPFRLKEKPPFDSLSNGAFVTSVFIAGYVFHATFTISEVFLHAVFSIFFGVSAIHIIGALRDYTPDKKTNVRTIAVVWGQKFSAFFAAFLFTLVYITVSKFPLEYRIYSLMAIGFSLILTIWPNEKRSMQLGFSLLFLFFLTAVYSLLFNSWSSLLN